MWMNEAETISKPFANRYDAIEFAFKNRLNLKNVKSRPAGYVVER